MISKILFVECSLTENDNSMSTCYNLKCNKIKQNFDYYDISKKLEIDVTKYDKVLFGCRSLYIYKCYKSKDHKILKPNFEKLMEIPNKYFIIQDMHKKTYGNIDTLCEILNKNNFNIIFTFYTNIEASIIRKKTPNCKYFHLHHYIDTNIFSKKDVPKEIDILLFGSIHPTHYPFRKRIFELILNNKDKFNVKFIEKPESFNPEVCEHGLVQLLNKSKISIATKSKYDYLVGKYFEIPASGCLIIGDIPTDSPKELRDFIINIDNNYSDDEILEIIANTINNYETYVDKINSFNKYVVETYNLDKYIEHLKIILG